jgi:hypothetical protein
MDISTLPKHKQILLETVKRRQLEYVGKSAKGRALIKDLAEAMKGDYMAMARLKEAISSQDFPILFGQVTQLALQGQYARLPQQWTAFSSRYTASNLKNQRVMDWNTTFGQLPAQNGGEVRHDFALPRIPELTEFPTFKLEARGTEWGLNKYGARFPFSFEAFINDELQVIQEMPGEMAAMGRDTEDVLTTGVLASSTGPNPDYFNSAWNFGSLADAGNILAGNPALSVDALEQAMQEIGLRRINGLEGRPVQVPNGWVLVVPPSMEILANEIAAIASQEIVRGDPATGDGQVRFVRTNQARGRFTVQVNQWLPLIDTSDTSATTWYLVPKAGTTGTRKAIVTSFLAGHEAPELRIKNDAGMNIGGGDISPFEGSFINDDVQYRVRHFVGAAGIDPSPSMVSLGTGNDS